MCTGTWAVGSVEIPKTCPVHATSAGVTCDHDGGATVSDAYPAPFPFTGAIRRIVVELSADGERDSAGGWRSALAEE